MNFKKLKSWLSYYTFFTISYLLVFIIPYILIFSVLYNNLITSHINNVIDNNTNVLRQVQNSVDSSFKSLERISIQMISDPVLKKYQSHTSFDEKKELIEKLGSVKNSSDNIYDIILYYNDSEEAYSSTGTFYFNNWFDNIYNFENLDSSLLNQLVSQMENPVVLPYQTLRNDISSNSYSKSIITYMYPIFADNKKAIGALIFFIDEKEINNVTERILNNTNTKTLIYNTATKTIMSSNDMNFSSHIDKLSIYDNEAEHQIITINNQKYYVLYLSSNINPWIYVVYLTSDSITYDLIAFKNNALLTFIIIFILSIFLIVKIIKVNYAPIQKILFVISNSKNDKQVSLQKRISFTDFENIGIGIQEIYNKNDEQSKNIITNKKIANQQYLLKLINGPVSDYDEILYITNELKISKSNFLVVLIEIEPLNEGYNYEHITSALQSNFKSSIRLYVVNLIGSNNISLILSFDDDEKNIVESTINNISDYINGINDLNYVIGIGKSYNSILQLYHSYAEARSASEHSFILGKNQIIYFEQICGISDNFSWYSNNEIEYLIPNIINSGLDNVKEYIFNFVSNLKDNKTPLYIAKLQCIDIFSSIIKLMKSMNISMNDIGRESLNILDLMEFKTIDELQYILYEIMVDFINCITNNNNKTDNINITDIIDYISKECYSYSFSIEQIAAHFSISLSNLYRIFKEQSNKNMSDYVIYFRIEKAKELLKTTNLTVNEIVSQVGYIDASKFIKKFKQFTCMTPGQFRKSS